MKLSKKKSLPDVQNTRVNSIAINRVGVTRIDFPLKISDVEKVQKVSARVNLFGSLPRNWKGTNMSRFLEVLVQYKDIPMNRKTLRQFLKTLIKKLETNDVYSEMEFDYFMDKAAPVTKGKVAPLAYKCIFIGRLLQNKIYKYSIKVIVPITSVCPCSAKISKFGAHNQRGYITAQILFNNNKSIPLGELISLIEKEGSAEVYPLLKRMDEKYVTEQGYMHPKFVEDIARDVAIKLQERKEVRKIKVKVENFESIHAHNATAYIFKKRKGNVWVSDTGATI